EQRVEVFITDRSEGLHVCRLAATPRLTTEAARMQYALQHLLELWRAIADLGLIGDRDFGLFRLRRGQALGGARDPQTHGQQRAEHEHGAARETCQAGGRNLGSRVSDWRRVEGLSHLSTSGAN